MLFCWENWVAWITFTIFSQWPELGARPKFDAKWGQEKDWPFEGKELQFGSWFQSTYALAKKMGFHLVLVSFKLAVWFFEKFAVKVAKPELPKCWPELPAFALEVLSSVLS